MNKRAKRIEIDGAEFKFWASKGWANRLGEQLDATKPYILVDEYGDVIESLLELTPEGEQACEEDDGYGAEQRARISQLVEGLGLDEEKMFKDIAKRKLKEEAKRAKRQAKIDAQAELEDKAAEEDSLSSLQERLRGEAMNACAPPPSAAGSNEDRAIKAEKEGFVRGPKLPEEGVEQLPWGQRQYRGKTVTAKNMQKIYDAIDELDHVVGKYPTVRQLLARKGWTLRHVAVMAGVSRTTVTRWRDQDASIPLPYQVNAYYNFTKRNPKAAIESLMRG